MCYKRERKALTKGRLGKKVEKKTGQGKTGVYDAKPSGSKAKRKTQGKEKKSNEKKVVKNLAKKKS